jgi:hypothetical protein|eukprot:COSAG06_NODE_8100_length_2273_cov_3.034039_4_plen_75_part_00
MQTKVLSGPPGSLLWCCIFSWQQNAAGGSAETARNSKLVDHSKSPPTFLRPPDATHSSPSSPSSPEHPESYRTE